MPKREQKSKTADAKTRLSFSERAAVNRNLTRVKAKTGPRLKIRVEATGTKISVDHPNKIVGAFLFNEALGTSDFDFADGTIRQLVDYSLLPEKQEQDANYKLAIIKGIKPQNEIETMLAVQMAATHIAAMTMAKRLAAAESHLELESFECAFNKLARTFISQMQALKQYRGGLDPKVIQQVTVSEGGQAIVGNVTQAARDAPGDPRPPSQAALTDAQMVPMPEQKASAPLASVHANEKQEK